MDKPPDRLALCGSKFHYSPNTNIVIVSEF